ncbi:MAG: ABC transporter substrate-binding protein [Pseudonocardiaceae bacterium]
MADGRANDGAQDRPGAAINPRRPPLRRPRTWITIVAAIAVLATTVSWWGPWRTVRVTCGQDVLTDGISDITAKDFLDVQGLIHDENERVIDSGRPWVSIAVMLPIRTGDPYTLSFLHQIQGAYITQYWSNHRLDAPDDPTQFSDDAPLIKLLIADTGREGKEWPETVKQLMSCKDDEHLVAVTGLSPSKEPTQHAINALANEGITMVSSTATATDLATNEIAREHHFRVSPNNSDEAAAAIEHLETTTEWNSASSAKPYKAFLVQNKDNEDTYATDLGDKYRKRFPKDSAAHILRQGVYDSSKPAAGNALDDHAESICANHYSVVFFAGRGDDLRTFLSHLDDQPCGPLTVISGDDASELATPSPKDHLMWDDPENDIEVIYTALATPQAWAEQYRNYIPVVQRPVDQKRWSGECAQCFPRLFPGTFLDDGDAIMLHDAVLTAVTAVRKVATQNKPQPVADDLFNGINAITQNDPVRGASGWIHFEHDADAPAGVPYDKAVPIMQLKPDSTAELRTLSSRSGTPATR